MPGGAATTSSATSQPGLRKGGAARPPPGRHPGAARPPTSLQSAATCLEVVGAHEEVGNAGAHHAQDPLVEALGLALQARKAGLAVAC